MLQLHFMEIKTKKTLKYQNPLAFLFLSLIHCSELVIWILELLYRSPLLVYKKETLKNKGRSESFGNVNSTETNKTWS